MQKYRLFNLVFCCGAVDEGRKCAGRVTEWLVTDGLKVGIFGCVIIYYRLFWE